MSENEQRPSRAVRPRDASTLVLLRTVRGKRCVLMGQRHSSLKFFPDSYVFPGGRIDRADHYVEPATPLHRDVAEILERSASPRRARALALTAVRETFEETGMILGEKLTNGQARAPGGWQEFFDTGYAPALNGLEYIHRAVTPPFRPIRFNARFFLADGEHLHGNLNGSGELVNLDWLPVEKAKGMNIPAITKYVLEQAEKIVAAPEQWRKNRKVPVFRHLHGRRHITDE